MRTLEKGKKKDAAFVQALLPVLLSVGMIFGVLLFVAQLMEVFRAREQIDQTARAYLLEMETTGYLSDTCMRALLKELEEYGLTEPELLGTTVLPVAFGDQIQLVISGRLEKSIELAIPFLTKESRRWTIPVKLVYLSTAKH